MTDWTDDDVLADQYEDASDLAARQVLYARYSEQSRHEWLFDQFDLPQDASVLSVGAGHGALWSANADRIPGDWDVTVTDWTPGMTMDAMDALEDVDVDFNFDTVDVRDIPYPEDAFDAATAHHVLYHLDDADREDALAELRRVLKPGGELYAATHGTSHLAELYDVAEHYGDVPDELGFTLENGGDQLRDAFDDVERRRRDAGPLRVTDPEPLVAYVLSLPGFDPADGRAMERDFRDRIGDDALSLTRDTGVFVAR